MMPGGAAMATEMKKVEGLPILVERTQTMGPMETKSSDEVTAVASKDAPEGAYDVPKDYAEKPFDPRTMGGMGGMGGGPGGGRKGGRPRDAGGDTPKGGEKTPPPPPKQD